jgi:hypothetical protein
VSQSDLERDLTQEGTRVRVAISLLEEAGLLRRGPDVPRMATLRINHGSPPTSSNGSADAFRAFIQAVPLRPGQPLDLDLLTAARQAEQPLDTIEQSVLEWAEAGWLTYNASGRDMLLELPPAPPDAAQRVETLIERHATIQVQRVDEIVSYAQARRCRHGHLNAYLGGQAIERCIACDNCVEIPPRAPPALPDERAQLQTILACVDDAPWSWGRVTLIRILRGDPKTYRRTRPLRQQARDQAQFGALAFRTEGALGHLLDRLLGGGFLSERRFERGTVIELTEAGQAAIAQSSLLNSLIPPPSSQATARTRANPSQPSPKAELAEPDPLLLEKLRDWRLILAKERQVPPYVILHNSHLADIAARRPTTREALSQIKGVGPKRLEQYGQALLDIVHEHLESND